MLAVFLVYSVSIIKVAKIASRPADFTNLKL